MLHCLLFSRALDNLPISHQQVMLVVPFLRFLFIFIYFYFFDIFLSGEAQPCQEARPPLKICNFQRYYVEGSVSIMML